MEVSKVFYDINKRYEVTINMEKQYENKPSRLSECINDFRFLVQRLNGYCRYSFQPELSEPIKGNKKLLSRWHYHGWIEFIDADSIVEFLACWLHKAGTKCDLCIHDYRPDYWPKYCDKQKHIIKPYLENKQLVYNITHDLPRLTKATLRGASYYGDKHL